MRLARLVLLWERLWPALWPASATAGVFLALSLMDLWWALPGWLHVVLLMAFALALVAALVQAGRAFTWPDRFAAQRRLEGASGLVHRPLTGLVDELAGDPRDAGTRALWNAHKARLHAAVRRLRVGWPRAGLARRDPLGLRAVVGLLLVIGVAVGGEEGDVRLARAFAPDFSGSVVEPAALEAWISPPDYTGAPPLYLEPGDHRDELALVVPVGSEVVARVHGAAGNPALAIDGAEVLFETIAGRDFQIAREITAGQLLVVSQGQTVLGVWALTVKPDMPPSAAFAEPPGATVRSTLRIPYEADDDYQVESVVVVVERDEGRSMEVPLALAGPERSLRETSYQDLTAHPWAGLEVSLQLIATDSIGQTGASEAVSLILPEKVFTNPVARAIIEQRRKLVEDPDKREDVARALEAISKLRRDYNDDAAVFLNLQSAAKRLRYDDSDKAVEEVTDQLWDTALRTEDAGLSLAEAELRRAEQALMDALARKAPDAELEALMDRLQQALDRFLEALSEQAERLAQEGELAPIDPDTMMLSSEELQSMLDRIRELSQTGARDRARELLSQLQSLLENLRPGSRQMALPRGSDDAQRMLNELGDLTRQQQNLLDETFRRGQRGREPGDEDGAASAAEQEALRRMLGDIMGQLGDLGSQIPGSLGQAEQSMRASRDALGEGDDEGAAGAQSNAVDQLRRGAAELLTEMLEQLGDEPGPRGQGQLGVGEDPLGRGMREDGGFYSDGEVEIPDRGALQRARTIIEELHRRIGDRGRSPAEREYLDRLLRRF